MNIALVGYGKMGHTIEEIATERGHKVVVKIDDQNMDDLHTLDSKNVDLAIEFTTPEAAASNVKTCISKGIIVICGTTGWNAEIPDIIEYCRSEKGTFFYSSNFSLGVNIFFEINRKLATIMNRFPDYSVDMKEIHHVHKKDSPSGTAITLAEGIIENMDRMEGWRLSEAGPKDIKIEAIREDEVPGTHIVNYESNYDKITISHEAKTRKGFALGAVLVSEWIAKGNKMGFLTMKDFLDL